MPVIATRRVAISVLPALILFAASFGVGRAGQSEPEPAAPRAAKAPAIGTLSTPAGGATARPRAASQAKAGSEAGRGPGPRSGSRAVA